MRNERCDVHKALVQRRWKLSPRSGSRLLVSPNGRACWAPSNDRGDSSVDGDRGVARWTTSFSGEVPAHVIVAACEAAAGVSDTTKETTT